MKKSAKKCRCRNCEKDAVDGGYCYTHQAWAVIKSSGLPMRGKGQK